MERHLGLGIRDLLRALRDNFPDGSDIRCITYISIKQAYFSKLTKFPLNLIKPKKACDAKQLRAFPVLGFGKGFCRQEISKDLRDH